MKITQLVIKSRTHYWLNTKTINKKTIYQIDYKFFLFDGFELHRLNSLDDIHSFIESERRDKKIEDIFK
jgi:hypothetical protein